MRASSRRSLLAVEAGGGPSERRLRDPLVKAARLVDRLDLGQSQVRLAVLFQSLGEEKPGVHVAGVAGEQSAGSANSQRGLALPQEVLDRLDPAGLQERAQDEHGQDEQPASDD